MVLPRGGRGGGYTTKITKFTTELLAKLHPTRPTHSHLIQFACFTGTNDVVWTVLAHCHQQSFKLSVKLKGSSLHVISSSLVKYSSLVLGDIFLLSLLLLLLSFCSLDIICDSLQ